VSAQFGVVGKTASTHRRELEIEEFFAIMGLRSIFFALAGIIHLFHYLQYGLSIILISVGIKMVLSNVYKVPVGIALGVVAGILAVAVPASVLWPPKKLEVLPVEADPSRDLGFEGIPSGELLRFPINPQGVSLQIAGTQRL
jgi:hypothetical protein